MKKFFVFVAFIVIFCIYCMWYINYSPNIGGYKRYIRDYKKGFIIFELINGTIVETNTKIPMLDLKECWEDKTIYRKVDGELVEMKIYKFYNDEQYQ